MTAKRLRDADMVSAGYDVSTIKFDINGTIRLVRLPANVACNRCKYSLTAPRTYGIILSSE